MLHEFGYRRNSYGTIGFIPFESMNEENPKKEFLFSRVVTSTCHGCAITTWLSPRSSPSHPSALLSDAVLGANLANSPAVHYS